jgi:hypothetical protein
MEFIVTTILKKSIHSITWGLQLTKSAALTWTYRLRLGLAKVMPIVANITNAAKNLPNHIIHIRIEYAIAL